jgi:hypothetical protein
MAGKPFDLTVQQQDLINLRKTLRAETDGKRLEVELRADFRASLEPLLPEIRAGALEYHNGTLGTERNGALGHGGDSLGEAVAAGVKVGVNLSGRLAGARIYISKKGMPRQFRDAPRDINRPGGWKHPNWGRGESTQIGKPNFFDKPIKARLDQFRAVAQAVMDRMAARIAARR